MIFLTVLKMSNIKEVTAKLISIEMEFSMSVKKCIPSFHFVSIALFFLRVLIFQIVDLI